MDEGRMRNHGSMHDHRYVKRIFGCSLCCGRSIASEDYEERQRPNDSICSNILYVQYDTEKLDWLIEINTYTWGVSATVTAMKVSGPLST